VTIICEARPGEIEAPLNYLLPTVSRPYTYPGRRGSDEFSKDTFDPRRVPIRNARVLGGQTDLDHEGFRLVRHQTRVRNFYNPREVRELYYPEVAALVRHHTGAARVIAFGHRLRSSSGNPAPGVYAYEVVRRVHNDYTDVSGPEAISECLGTEAGERMRRRFAIVQVWRPIQRAVARAPLALCDAQSVSPGDLVDSERHTPTGVVRTYMFTYNSAHRWFWFPQMQVGEALLFKVYDSMTDGRARWVPHAAFDDPNTAADALPRESIETRTLVCF